MDSKNKVLFIFAITIILIPFLFHNASAINMCGVTLHYGITAATTSNSPCIIVNSVNVNSSGITIDTIPNHNNITYKTFPQSSGTPINMLWTNESSTESDWVITNAISDASMNVTGIKVNSLILDYINSPDQLQSGNVINQITIDKAKIIQLLLNTPSPIPPIVPQVFAQAAIYNQTALPVSTSWASLTRTPGTTLETLVDSGSNGTYTQIWQARTSNKTLSLQLGSSPPSLPLSLDTFTNSTADASTNATQNLSITIGNNNNRMMLVGISYLFNSTVHNNARIQSVSIGSLAFTNIINKTVACSLGNLHGTANQTCDNEIWALENPPIGAKHITITPKSTSAIYYMTFGAYSLYNVLDGNGITTVYGTSSSATGYTATPTISITPTNPSAWIFDNLQSNSTNDASSASNTVAWNQRTSSSGMMGGSQRNQNPTISSSNTLSWTTTNPHLWTETAVEIKAAQNPINNSFNLGCQPVGNNIMSNGSTIYYSCINNANSININTGIQNHLFTINNSPVSNVFLTHKNVIIYAFAGGADAFSSLAGGNSSIGTHQYTLSNQQLGSASDARVIRFNYDNAIPINKPVPNPCSLTFLPTNDTSTLDTVDCDPSIPANDGAYGNGLLIQNVGGYTVNSTMQFYNSVFASPFKQILTLTGAEYNGGFSEPFANTILHTNINYLVVIQPTKIFWIPTTTLTSTISPFSPNIVHATQTYFTILQTDSSEPVVPSPTINTVGNMHQFGPSLNSTIQRYGATTLISGYTLRPFSNTVPGIRTIDPQWTFDTNNYPITVTTGALFPVFLTVNNAPTNGAIEVTNPYVSINSAPALWSVTRLDTTHSAEFDIPVGTCVNIYVADSSIFPPVYNFEGNICATGANSKTIAYTNTLPLNFWTLKYGATHVYTASNNALQTTVRSTISPFTYNLIIKNSTGSVGLNRTITSLSTLDTQNFNVSGIAKPASLFISVSGVPVYSAYLGSSVSLASVASFFNQYFTYQGFSLVAFIPIIFASMFTRNTVGIGTVLTVLCIATLSWLSVIVIPDLYIYIMVTIAVIGLVAYRIYYG